MGLGKCFSMAMSSIVSSKMRSFLTMLGIIIGIMAVIVLVSLMNGLTGMVTDSFEEMGTTSINVTVMSRATTKYLDPDDAFEFAEENSEYISGISPSVSANVSMKVSGSTDEISSSATGVAETYMDMKQLVVEQGRFIQYIDVEREQKVCVIGTYQAQELFGGNAVGQNVKINGLLFKVVGVLEEKEDSTSGSADDCVYIPYTTACKMNGTSTVSSYLFTAVDEDRVPIASSLIEDLLLKKIGDEDYYRVIDMLSMIDTMTEMMDTMGMVLVAIAGISLLVGGIGIMNIMLVSVTERTREIGIRKSLGARQKHIMSQFVIEAGVISCIGGVIGIILGILISKLGGNLLNIDAAPSVTAIVASFSISAGIGIAFGFLPARKAAKLNPIDALRYD